ncbi:unnamed protein product, partial [Allacma fusca]
MWLCRLLFGRESTQPPPSTNSTIDSWKDRTGNESAGVEAEDLQLLEKKTQLEGVITKLDRNDSGVISNSYRFYYEDEIFSPDLAKGTVVTFNAERKWDCAIWTATDIKIKGTSRESAEEDESRCLHNTISVNYRVFKILQDRIIVGPSSSPKMKVEIGKEHLPKEYLVVLGDWLHIIFKGETEDDITNAEVISVNFTEMVSKDGIITKKRGHFCIDGWIYFTGDLIQDGKKVCAGDRASVTAVASDQVQSRGNSRNKYIFKNRAVSIEIVRGSSST